MTVPGTTDPAPTVPEVEAPATPPTDAPATPEPPAAAPVVPVEPEVPAKVEDEPPAAPVTPAEVPAAPEPVAPVEPDPAPQVDEKTQALQTRLRAALIAAHSVAPELESLLPQDVDALETFLGSPDYEALKVKLSKETLPPPDSQAKAPEPPPKTPEQDSRASLTRIGLTLTGG